jgi:hypothetical protein
MEREGGDGRAYIPPLLTTQGKIWRRRCSQVCVPVRPLASEKVDERMFTSQTDRRREPERPRLETRTIHRIQHEVGCSPDRICLISSPSLFVVVPRSHCPHARPVSSHRRVPVIFSISIQSSFTGHHQATKTMRHGNIICGDRIHWDY